MIHRLTRTLACCAICCTALLFADAPVLEPKDVSIQMKEVLRSHATYKKLDPELAKRSLVNFMEELDPTKTYLLESEVDRWTNPPPELLAEVLAGYERNDYSHFAAIYQLMAGAIERRNRLEENLLSEDLPKGVDAKELKDLSWAKGEPELRERLAKIRSLQIEASHKLEPESAQLALDRLQKRRLRQEGKLLGESQEERRQLMLATVLKATAAALDSQTAYFTPEEAADFVNQLQKRLFGIGVQLRDNLNGFSVLRIVEGGPAETQGQLKAGDLIISVDGESVVGMDILDAVQLIRGPEGSKVALKVIRENTAGKEKREELVDVSIERGEVVLKETRIEVETEPFADGVIGRIALHSFYQDRRDSSASDLKNAIQELKSEHNLKGLILDLRQNAGGLLPQAVEVTGLFVTKGIICSIRDGDGTVHHLRDLDADMAWDGPLIVLVSRASASASEIVAGCLQDYGRALIVGDPTTYGKGTFQTSTIDTLAGRYVNPKGEFKVTRGTYYTVSGKSPQLKGVESDVIVPGLYSEMELGEKYAKFPLEADRIKENFHDDLADISFHHRAEAIRTYRFNLQPKLGDLNPHVGRLQNNSELRLKKNSSYQTFLSLLRGEAKQDEQASDSDFQLIETYNIMKDLILLDKQS